MYGIKPLINQMKEKGLKSTKFNICDKNDKTVFTININKNDDKYNLELIVSDHIKTFLIMMMKTSMHIMIKIKD